MKTNLFILCYNEEVLLPHTIGHYKKYLPNCNITILDNESTDNSVDIAERLGCAIVSFNSRDIQNEFIQLDIKNNCWKWKNQKDGWIIVIDMDEWLCVTAEDLRNEYTNGTTILNVKGLNMICEKDLVITADTNLNEIRKYLEHPPEDKKLCFLSDKINEIDYGCGAHECKPQGIIKYSSKTYINKHMHYLGEAFLVKKMNDRYERTHLMRKHGMDGHYTDNAEIVKKDYDNVYRSSKILETELPI